MNWKQAHRSYTTCVEGLRAVGHISDVLGCSITLADIRITQGRLTDALGRPTPDALRLAADDPLPVTRGTADMHVGLSGVAYERNDLATAAHHLRLARELGDAAGLPQNPYRWRVAQARLHAAQGDLPQAVELLNEAEQVYFGDFAPNVRPIAARCAPGSSSREGTWPPRPPGPAPIDLAADDELSYMREFEHITLAMVLLAQHRAGHSQRPHTRRRRLLERLLVAARGGRPDGQRARDLVQLALASEAEGGNRARATDLLRPRTGPGRARGPHPSLPRRRTRPDRAAPQRRPGSPGGAARACGARRR